MPNVSIAVGQDTMSAYLARPEGDAPKPAVLLFQEIFGVNAEMRRVADLLAGAGYVALAIDLFHRVEPNVELAPTTPEGRQKGFALAKTFTRAGLREDSVAAIAWLASQPFVAPDRIATWGFCVGGSIAFLSATLPGLRGAICFYGSQIAKPFHGGEPPALAEAANVRVPLLLGFGEKDESIPPEAIALIEKTLRDAGKQAETVVFPGVGHAFFREGNGTPEAKADAWARVRAFLAKTLA